MLTSEHIYTHGGWQRPVLMQPGTARVRFVAEGAEVLQVSYDPVESVRRGQGRWEEHPVCGVLEGITAVRVRVAEEGVLRIQQDGKEVGHD